MTDGELQALRVEVGDAPSQDQLDEAMDRLGSVAAVALEFARVKLHRLLDDPASFSIAGQYSQDASSTIVALKEQTERLQQQVVSERTGGQVGVVTATTLRRVRPGR